MKTGIKLLVIFLTVAALVLGFVIYRLETQNVFKIQPADEPEIVKPKSEEHKQNISIKQKNVTPGAKVRVIIKNGHIVGQ